MGIKVGRWRVQFTLRTLFVIVLWGALVSGWVTLGVTWIRYRHAYECSHRFMTIAMIERERGGNLLVYENAIFIPLERYVLVRTESGVGAFLLTGTGELPRGAIAYHWYFSPTGSFGGMDVSEGNGLLFENYAVGPVVNGMQTVRDAGSQAFIVCGPIQVEWSEGNYVYLPEDLPMEIAFTNQQSLACVDASTPSLIWLARKRVTLSASIDASGPGSP